MRHRSCGFDSRAAIACSFFCSGGGVHRTSRVWCAAVNAIDGDALLGVYECPDPHFCRDSAVEARTMYPGDGSSSGDARASSTSPEPKRAEAPYFERAAREICSSATPPGVGSAKIRAEAHYARRFLDFWAWSFFGAFLLLTSGDTPVDCM